MFWGVWLLVVIIFRPMSFGDAISFRFSIFFALYQNEVNFWAVFDNEIGTAQPIADSNRIYDEIICNRTNQQSVVN